MRPERAAPPSPGQRPGYVLVIKKRPVRAKALKYQMIYKAFALTGRLVYVHDYPGRCPGLGASALSGRVANRGDLLISILLSCGESGRFVLFQSSYHVANLGDSCLFFGSIPILQIPFQGKLETFLRLLPFCCGSPQTFRRTRNLF